MNPGVEDILKQELGPEFAYYEEGLNGRKRKGFCDTCIDRMRKRGEGQFYPQCRRSTDEHVDAAFGQDRSEATQFYRNSMDAVEWAKWEFDWDARWYQAQALRCSSLRQAWRWGRRSGKSETLAVRTLHLAATRPGVPKNEIYTVLLVTPYEAQLDKIFEMIRNKADISRTIKPTRDIKDPHTLEFANKSKIIGFTAGDKTGARSTKIRGQDAHAIIIDEADYLRDDDIGTVLAILASHAECKLVFSSTPRGTMTRFRKACEDVKLRFREFWVASHESPVYQAETDEFYRRITTTSEYEHEILGLFSAAEGGVFTEEQIKKATKKYPMGSPAGPDEDVVIGVDSNDAANGTHAVIMACNPMNHTIRVLDTDVLRGEKFSQPASQRRLVELCEKWNPMVLALDKGYAHGQIDGLMEYGLMHPESRISDILYYYDLGSKFKFIDPINGQEFGRPMKPMMVGLTQRHMQMNRLIIPAAQDTDTGILGQMRSFFVKGQQASGAPIYTQGNEHTLTALMIGIMGWLIEIVGIRPGMPDTKLATHIDADVPEGLQTPIAARGELSKSDGEWGPPVPLYPTTPINRSVSRSTAPSRTQLPRGRNNTRGF